MFVRLSILGAFACLTGMIIANEQAEAQECQVTLEESRQFYNGCPYTVFVTYEAICQEHTFRELGKGPIQPGNYSDAVVGGRFCSYNWGWRAY